MKTWGVEFWTQADGPCYPWSFNSRRSISKSRKRGGKLFRFFAIFGCKIIILFAPRYENPLAGRTRKNWSHFYEIAVKYLPGDSISLGWSANQIPHRASQLPSMVVTSLSCRTGDLSAWFFSTRIFQKPSPLRWEFYLAIELAISGFWSPVLKL